ncbi:MAG: methyltransferase domain-containing protein [Hymenobacteraceae bacterium]|nr:methyltransferase domain-containing protein [Hymenobacteraceae bacterium]
MDDLALTGDALRQNLDELEYINKWLGGYAPITRGLALLCGEWPRDRVLRIADVGCGGGDTLRVMAAWARRRGLSVELIGIDANAFMIEYAREKCASSPEICFQQLDIFVEAFSQQSFDVVTCSLFCHHFAEETLAALLRQLAGQARRGVIVNDLHRHPLAYYSIRWLTRLLGGSYLVQHDAPLSVARAFQRADIVALCARAGVAVRRLRWHWAFRWELVVTTRVI